MPGSHMFNIPSPKLALLSSSHIQCSFHTLPTCRHSHPTWAQGLQGRYITLVFFSHRKYSCSDISQSCHLWYFLSSFQTLPLPALLSYILVVVIISNYCKKPTSRIGNWMNLLVYPPDGSSGYPNPRPGCWVWRVRVRVAVCWPRVDPCSALIRNEGKRDPTEVASSRVTFNTAPPWWQWHPHKKWEQKKER